MITRNLFVYAVEVIKVLIITVGIMGFKLKIKWHGILMLLLSAVTIIIIIVAEVSFISLIIGISAFTSVAALISGKHRLLCSCLAFLSVTMLDIMTAAVFMLVTKQDTSTLYDSTINHILVNSVSIVIISTIAAIRLRSKQNLYSIKYMRIAYIVTSIISQFCFLLYLTPALIMGFDGYSKPFIVVGLSFSGLFFIISNVLLVQNIFSKRQYKSLYKNSRDESENISDYFNFRFNKEKERQKLYHDIPYHLLSLKSLAENNQDAELKEYINRLAERFSECEQAVSTGNHQLNAIISGCIAKYPDSKVEIDGIMPNEINIPHHDFCIILSNLLDNAFKYSTGSVKIEINYNDDLLYVRVMNTINKKIKYTSGIGILNVSEYVAKNNGKVFYHCNDKYFIVDLYL